uniref:Uncharacterized protein n=1 Tax=Moschus moschiferus TaxID=68415 RepID=A0A8C6FGQ9_MOSMO
KKIVIVYVTPNPKIRGLECSHRWPNPLFKIGRGQKLKQGDTCSVFPEDRSQHLGEELQGYWDQEVLRAKSYKREPSLMKAIVQCYWKSCLVLGTFTFLEVKIFPCRALLSSLCRSVPRWV